MARVKSDENQDLPQYLRPERGIDYWRYSHPDFIKEFGKAKFFRADRAKAIALAKAANAKYEGSSLDDFLTKPTQKRRAGPKSKSSFSEVADLYFQYWREEKYADPDRNPAKSTQTNTRNRLRQAKEYFVDTSLNTITTEKMSQYYDSIASPHEYNKIGGLMGSMFEFARAKGLFDQYLPNPGRSAKLTKIPKATVRKSMEPHQFNAIYDNAPECLQITMSIVLQTSLRQADVWKMQWSDIDGDTLYVVDKKSRTNKRNDRRATFLKFDLSKNKELKKAINRARTVKIAMQGKREEFRDCPFILMNSEIKRLNKGCKTKTHPLQMTKREAGKMLKKVRDELVSTGKKHEGEPVFYDWTPEEMPAYHGIRKLSLQTLEDQGIEIDDLSSRAGHKDKETTEDIYLDRNHSAWVDSTFQVVDTKNWKPGDHRIDDLLRRAG